MFDGYWTIFETVTQVNRGRSECIYTHASVVPGDCYATTLTSTYFNFRFPGVDHTNATRPMTRGQNTDAALNKRRGSYNM